MENAPTFAETSTLIQRNWGLSLSTAESWDQLREALTIHIRVLLREDFNGLLNAMYRLDVPEQRFRTALEAASPDLVAALLTEAVLDRERLRAETRARYRSSTQQTAPDES